MDLNRPAQAADHFARALQSGSEATRSDAAYGQSLALLRMGLADEAAIAATAAPLAQNNAIELEIAILTRKATGAYDIGDYVMTLNLLDARARLAAERNDLLRENNTLKTRVGDLTAKDKADFQKFIDFSVQTGTLPEKVDVTKYMQTF